MIRITFFALGVACLAGAAYAVCFLLDAIHQLLIRYALGLRAARQRDREWHTEGRWLG